MYIAILGRQPSLGMAELERAYGPDNTKWFSDQSATVTATDFPLSRLGGTQKAGRVVIQLSSGDWRKTSMKIVQAYKEAWSGFDGKLTLGISAYGFDVSPREVQKTGIILKQKLKTAGVSLRLLPNAETALNTAASHHNKLGLSNNKIELIVVRARNGKVIVAESIGAQNITAYTKRDQGRPKRDAFVGMLPPKLAQIMINLAAPANNNEINGRLLDPFCGTGVILQEGALMGYSVYGTDLADKMIDYSKANLEWLAESHHANVDMLLHQDDAVEAKWQQPIGAVACESYLGQPFSAPPSPAKLDQVRKNCDHIISGFLKNIAAQIPAGTPLCVGIPAWRDTSGRFTHLPLISKLEQLGFTRYSFENIKNDELLYYREDQVVARELLVLVKS
jgi:tRNA (guanine10-N2)-dimethyltransferase